MQYRRFYFSTIEILKIRSHSLLELGLDYLYLVRMVGLEPTRGHPRKILSLVRLPFRHIRIRLLLKPRLILSQSSEKNNSFLIFFSEAALQFQSSRRLQNNLREFQPAGLTSYSRLPSEELPQNAAVHYNYIP